MDKDTHRYSVRSIGADVYNNAYILYIISYIYKSAAMRV